jgi:2-hydroxy-3-oxopropionate reductase
MAARDDAGGLTGTATEQFAKRGKPDMADIGFIGLGIMGRPMAEHLLAAGHRLHSSSHHKPVAPDLVERGVLGHATAQGVAAASEIVFLMLPDTPQVEEVLFSGDGVVAGLSAGKTVVDMSSISPMATKEFAERV